MRFRLLGAPDARTRSTVTIEPFVMPSASISCAEEGRGRRPTSADERRRSAISTVSYKRRLKKSEHEEQRRRAARGREGDGDESAGGSGGGGEGRSATAAEEGEIGARDEDDVVDVRVMSLAAMAMVRSPPLHLNVSIPSL